MLPIFNEEGLKRQIGTKIEACLQLVVRMSPCLSCLPPRFLLFFSSHLHTLADVLIHVFVADL